MKYFSYPIIALILFQSCQLVQDIETVVSTDKGEVEGVFNSKAGIYAFRGIPFAKAPVGDLRWQAPQPADEWQGILNSSEFGPICMQREPVPFSMWTQEFIAPGGNMSEDCLNLNIWTKEGSVDLKRPVIVFIHGGGFSSGSGSVPIYDGEKMAEKGVVFVTINYRVGIFGFLTHPELTEESENNVSGNYGLLDQIAALEWVQNNISNFGGDPKFRELNRTVREHSAVHFVANADEETVDKLTSIRWFVDCGDDDFLFDANIAFVEEMKQKEIPLQFRVRDGGHDWEYWHSALYIALLYISHGFMND